MSHENKKVQDSDSCLALQNVQKSESECDNFVTGWVIPRFESESLRELVYEWKWLCLVNLDCLGVCKKEKVTIVWEFTLSLTVWSAFRHHLMTPRLVSLDVSFPLLEIFPIKCCFQFTKQPWSVSDSLSFTSFLSFPLKLKGEVYSSSFQIFVQDLIP